MRVTLRPRDSRIAAREAEAIPLPREDTTPPVTKTNLVMFGTNLRSPRWEMLIIGAASFEKGPFGKLIHCWA